MPSAVAPFDRAIALACTMQTLRGRWLHVRCGYRASSCRPVRAMLTEDRASRGRTLADVVVHLRCHACKARPLSVHLTEGGYSPDVVGSVVPGWNVLLHGTEDGMGPIPYPDATRTPGAADVE